MPSLRKALKEIAMEKDAAVVSRVGVTSFVKDITSPCLRFYCYGYYL